MKTTQIREQIYEFIKLYVDTPEPKKLCSSIEDLVDELAEIKVKNLALPNVINWVAFDWMKIETRPNKCGKYLITRKDGKIHWETWNGSGWAYNHNEIRYWAQIKPPCL